MHSRHFDSLYSIYPYCRKACNHACCSIETAAVDKEEDKSSHSQPGGENEDDRNVLAIFLAASDGLVKRGLELLVQAVIVTLESTG